MITNKDKRKVWQRKNTNVSFNQDIRIKPNYNEDIIMGEKPPWIGLIICKWSHPFLSHPFISICENEETKRKKYVGPMP